MTHDPERSAASYLSGTMARRRRRMFEEHILECEECWGEVDLGRRGRALAEEGRELTPQNLRERVRMSIEAMPIPNRRGRRLAFGASVVAISLLTLFAALNWGQPEQPIEIALLVADFESGATLKTVTEDRLPDRLGDLKLRRSRAGRVKGMEVTAHEYVDPAGHEVVVYQADRTFPIAVGAEHAPTGETWTAELEDAVLFCADHPVPSLVVGDDRKEVELAATELGLR